MGRRAHTAMPHGRLISVVVLACAMVAGCSAAAGGAGAPTTRSAVASPSADTLSLARDQYLGLRNTWENANATFDIALSNTMASGDYSQLWEFAASEWARLTGFESQLTGVLFPQRAKADVVSMENADSTLVADLETLLRNHQIAGTRWVGQWQADAAVAKARHLAMDRDMGLPPASPQSSI